MGKDTGAQEGLRAALDQVREWTEPLKMHFSTRFPRDIVAAIAELMKARRDATWKSINHLKSESRAPEGVIAMFNASVDADEAYLAFLTACRQQHKEGIEIRAFQQALELENIVWQNAARSHIRKIMESLAQAGCDELGQFHMEPDDEKLLQFIAWQIKSAEENPDKDPYKLLKKCMEQIQEFVPRATGPNMGTTEGYLNATTIGHYARRELLQDYFNEPSHVSYAR